MASPEQTQTSAATLTATSKYTFAKGIFDSLPFFLVLAPFGLLFGVAGTEAGLNLVQVMGFSVFVVAGAAQLTAVQLLSENTPTYIAIITALAVNLRMAMYSAALTPHLGDAPFRMRAAAAYCLFDQPYALGTAAFEADKSITLPSKLSYYFGSALPIMLLWWSTTLTGALLAEKIPKDLGVEFAIPISFLAVVAPLLRSPAQILAALTSSTLVIVFRDFPNSSGLLAAAFVSLLVGAGVEVLLERFKGVQK